MTYECSLYIVFHHLSLLAKRYSVHKLKTLRFSWSIHRTIEAEANVTPHMLVNNILNSFNVSLKGFLILNLKHSFKLSGRNSLVSS